VCRNRPSTEQPPNKRQGRKSGAMRAAPRPCSTKRRRLSALRAESRAKRPARRPLQAMPGRERAAAHWRFPRSGEMQDGSLVPRSIPLSRVGSPIKESRGPAVNRIIHQVFFLDIFRRGGFPVLLSSQWTDTRLLRDTEVASHWDARIGCPRLEGVGFANCCKRGPFLILAGLWHRGQPCPFSNAVRHYKEAFHGSTPG
jgi:hypothetical protein